MITFAVTPEAAARIALADSNGGGVTGGIYLALEAAGNPAAAPTTITSANLIPASTTHGCGLDADDHHDHDRQPGHHEVRYAARAHETGRRA